MNKNCKQQCCYCYNGLIEFWTRPDARCPYCFHLMSQKMNKKLEVRGGYEKIRFGLNYQTWLWKDKVVPWRVARLEPIKIQHKIQKVK